MGKNKNKSRRQGWMSKALNIFGLFLAFLPEVNHFIFRKGSFENYLNLVTGDLSKDGKFNLRVFARGHSPRMAAVVFYGVKRLALRYFPVRK